MFGSRIFALLLLSSSLALGQAAVLEDHDLAQQMAALKVTDAFLADVMAGRFEDASENVGDPPDERRDPHRFAAQIQHQFQQWGKPTGAVLEQHALSAKWAREWTATALEGRIRLFQFKYRALPAGDEILELHVWIGLYKEGSRIVSYGCERPGHD